VKKRDSGKNAAKNVLRGRRGDWAREKASEDRMEDLRNVETLWNFEKEVERSRLSSTFQQIKLHEIFGDTLCDDMQPQKGICTPLALEQLQSEHLMSWMLSLGKERLTELLGRTYDLKRGEIIEV
jgi:hypothetical protein